MASELDHLLGRLRERVADGDLSGLEASVSAMLAREHANRSAAMGLKLQIGVVGTALAFGMLVSGFHEYFSLPGRLNSEIVVLSDDGSLAPSVRLGGGT